jgi:hypothetical protein
LGSTVRRSQSFFQQSVVRSHSLRHLVVQRHEIAMLFYTILDILYKLSVEHRHAVVQLSNILIMNQVLPRHASGIRIHFVHELGKQTNVFCFYGAHIVGVCTSDTGDCDRSRD